MEKCSKEKSTKSSQQSTPTNLKLTALEIRRLLTSFNQINQSPLQSNRNLAIQAKEKVLRRRSKVAFVILSCN